MDDGQAGRKKEREGEGPPTGKSIDRAEWVDMDLDRVRLEPPTKKKKRMAVMQRFSSCFSKEGNPFVAM